MRGARGPRRPTGFTLLEVLAAAALFALMSALILVNVVSSSDTALRSIRARELRLLAERRLGEIETFEKHYDATNFPSQDSDDYGEEWRDWEWDLVTRDVVIRGTTNDEAAEYLFGKPAEDDEETDPSGDAGGSSADPAKKEGATQYLRELTLTVSAPRDDAAGDERDSVTVVVFLPIVTQPGAAAPAPGPGGGGN